MAIKRQCDIRHQAPVQCAITPRQGSGGGTAVTGARVHQEQGRREGCCETGGRGYQRVLAKCACTNIVR